MGAERRRYVRFLAQDNAFAALRSGFEKVGKISDISLKGLSFSYFRKDVEADSNRNLSQVDIFLSGNGFHLPNVPCRIAYDIREPTSGISNSIAMYRCGLHFGELINNQSEQLIFFIKNYTEGSVMSNDVAQEEDVADPECTPQSARHKV
jgi:hypothetical protein